jgi:4-hydroxybenzoate polyprenyltransferase
MWQRKQTVFLLVAAVLGLVYMIAWPLFVIQVLASSVSVIAIFLYKRRPTQASVCLAATFANMAWYVVLAVLIHNGTLSEALPMTACLPIIAAILCFLARRAVIADEKLVRSADRIR